MLFWHKLGLTILTLIISAEQCKAYNEYFSSVEGLERLLTTEQKLLLDLTQFIEWTQIQLRALESELIKIEKEHTLAAADTENYLANPVNAYRLIKRLHYDWHSYENRVRSDNLNEYFLERMRLNYQRLDFPSQRDVDGAAVGLMRLQDIYQLDVAQLAAGVFNGIKYGNDMTWQDCFILGQQLYTLEDYNHTKVWFKEAMGRLSNEACAREPMSLEYMDYVAEKLLELGDLQGALHLTGQVLEVNPHRTKTIKLKETIELAMSNEQHGAVKEAVDGVWDYHHTEEYQVYEKICRGDILPSAAQLRPLRCRYLSNNVSYRLLAPFKVEEHSLDPYVITVHEALSEQKVETIKSLATPFMRRSTVNGPVVNESMTSDVRVSKTAWLPFDHHAYLQQMLREVHDLTGLNITYCEELQVLNYGMGGHYEPHWDFYQQPTDDEGNRIATAIFYLSNVELGGATAFPHLHFSVQPQRGSILFWYNLHRSLDKDYRSKHAACPVLQGSKWIANIWIRDIAQTFNRPCALYRDHEVSLEYSMPK